MHKIIFLAIACMHTAMAMESEASTTVTIHTSRHDPAVQAAFANIQKLKEKGNMEYVDRDKPYQWAYLWFVNRVTTKESIFLRPGTLQVLSSLSLTDAEGNVLEPARQAFDRLINLPKINT